MHASGSPTSVRRRIYALAVADEFGPIYALFTLWFIDNSVTTSQLSAVFVCWSVLVVVLEVPSGALADRVDRRYLIAGAYIARAGGIVAWLAWPSMMGLAIGAVLWALHDAAVSGAWEALIHDQLDAVNQTRSYGVVIARAEQFSHIGLALGTVVASSLTAVGFGIDIVGWVNVAVMSLPAMLVLSLPNVRWVRDIDSTNDAVDSTNDEVDSTNDEGSSWRSWWTTLRAGVNTVRHTPRLRRLGTIGALLGGLFIVDEYVPILARLRGASDTLVPILVLTVWLGLLAGAEIAARKPELSAATLASMLVAGAAVMAIALALDSPWSLVGIGIGYAAVEANWVAADARFQAAASRATRATVTSVRGLGEQVTGGIAFTAIGLMSRDDDPTAGLHWVVGTIALVAILVWWWLPGRVSRPRRQQPSVCQH